MRIQTTGQDLPQLKCDLAVAFAYDDDARPRGIDDRKLAGLLARRARQEGFSGKAGEVFLWSLPDAHAATRIAVIGLGKPQRLAEAVRVGCARAAKLAPAHRAASLALRLPGDTPEIVRAAVEGALGGAYLYQRHLTDPDRKTLPLKKILVSAGRGGAAVKRAVAQGERVARATSLARDLVNEPPSRMTPEILAGAARREAKKAGLTVKVLTPPQIRKIGMNALLQVGRGASSGARVVHLTYRPKKKPRRRVALIGKGVCFDSGGLNLKPTEYMLHMKGDMGGAAAVLAAMTTLGESGCPDEVHGLLGLVENLTGADAYKPGDILDTYSGKTVEIGNTDAEGRLVLCDLLAWADATLSPDVIVDVATLTGAVVVALGTQATAIFTGDDGLRAELLAAAEAGGEKLWPLPLYEEYLALLQRGPADLNNVGGRWGGAITAALFLREFVSRDRVWAHLDIAGPAFNETDSPVLALGGTGAAVPTLARWLERG